MKDYLLISNTKENKINDFYLNFVSSHIEKSTNKKISYRELSYRKAYEWELPSNKYDSKLKKIISDFQSNHGIDCNFIKTTEKRKKKTEWIEACERSVQNGQQPIIPCEDLRSRYMELVVANLIFGAISFVLNVRFAM